MDTYSKPSEALAKIPQGAKFTIGEKGKGSGTPAKIVNPYALESPDQWTRADLEKELADNADKWRGRQFVFRPLNEKGVSVTSKRFSLDLSMSEESTSIDTSPSPGAEMAQFSQSMPVPYLQESLVAVLMGQLDKKDEEIKGLREDLADRAEENSGLREEIFALKLAAAGHDRALADAKKNTPLDLNSVANTFLGDEKVRSEIVGKVLQGKIGEWLSSSK